MPLTDAAIRALKPKDKQYRITDGRGMYVLVLPGGGRHFRLDYKIHGKRRTYSIGTYPETTLMQARKLRDEAKALVKDGVDPTQHRRQVREAQREDAESTFEAVAIEWFDKKKSAWAPGYARTVEQRLRMNVFPYHGRQAITEITARSLLRSLRKIEDRGAVETAYRTRQVASAVFRYGIACGICDNDPAASLVGALAPKSPKRMAAITDPAEVGALMRAIAGYQGDIITRCALRLQALTAVRPGELRHADWSEIVWASETWEIPAKRMKMKRPHVVPLSRQAIEVLRELHPVTGDLGKYVFPSVLTHLRPMSENTVNAALRRMGYTKAEMTGHGFRSTFSTMAHEAGWDHQDIELQLSHARRDQIAAAYDRSKRLPERKRLMQWYGDLLDRLQSGEEPEGAEQKTVSTGRESYSV